MKEKLQFHCGLLEAKACLFLGAEPPFIKLYATYHTESEVGRKAGAVPCQRGQRVRSTPGHLAFDDQGNRVSAGGLFQALWVRSDGLRKASLRG